MLGDMWQSATQVNTPVALLAFLIAAGAFGFGVWVWRRYSTINHTPDQNKRAEMLRDLLGRFAPDMENLTREQKDRIINRQITYGFIGTIVFVFAAWSIAIGIVYAAIHISNNQVRAAEEQKTPDDKAAPHPTPPVVLASSLPLGRMENFRGDALIHESGEKYRSGDVFRLFDRQEREVGTAYPVIVFDLVKSRPGVVKLDKTRVNWTPVELRPITLTSTVFGNFKPPLTFLAKLNRKLAGQPTETVANIKIADGITDGSIDFSDELPVRKCRVEFEGTPGLYRINSVELDLADIRTEQKLTLKSPFSVFVYVLPPK